MTEHRPWAALCLVLAGVATADERSPGSCTGIANDTARLACYDAAFGVHPSSHSASGNATPSAAPPPSAPPGAAPAPSVVPLPPAAKSPEDAFGDTGNLHGSQKPSSPKRITATVLNAVPLGQGLYRLRLDNGQTWQTTQADWALDFNPNDSVTISRMTLGNYLISRTGQGRTIAIKRIQ